MAHKKFWLGTLALAFWFIVAGCEHNAPPGSVNVQTSFEDETVDLGVVVLTGKVELEGRLIPFGEGEEKETSSLGTISKDGKLNMELPSDVDDDDLFAVPGGTTGLKGAGLSISATIDSDSYDLKLMMGDDVVNIFYFNKSGTVPTKDDEYIAVKKGWNYVEIIGEDEYAMLEDLSDCEWVLVEAQASGEEGN